MIKKLFHKFLNFHLSILILLIAFLSIKILFMFKSEFWISFLSDLISIPIVILVVKKFIGFQNKRKFTQIQLLTGFIILEIIFILFSETSLYFLGPTLKSLKSLIIKPTLFIGIISGFFSVVYIFFISIILSILTILFFSRQKTTIKNYYVITIVYFILSSLGANFEKYYDILWIKYTFGTLTIAFFIVLTYLNKWVVYLKRKEKLKVIGLCNILLVIIIFAMIKSGSKEQLEELISLFSSSIVTAYNLIFGMALIYSIVLLILTIFQLPATEVIEKKTFEIESLQNLSQMISKVLDIDELTSFIIQTISKMSNSNYVWLCLYDEKDICSFYSRNNNQKVEIDNIKDKIIQNVAPTSGINIIDLDSLDTELNTNTDISKILYIPLVYGNNLLGYIFLGFDKSTQLEMEDFNTLKSIGEYAVVAVQNSRLLQKSIEKERLEKELEVAREIQRKLLPNESPKIPELDIASMFIPAFEVGGDYFDFFQTKEDEFSFVIADVSGKGISAAFYMAEVKGIFESLSKIIFSPKEILIQANKILCKSLDKKSFVSAVFATINLKSGIFKIARGGHCPIIIMKDKAIKHLRPSGIALGFNCSNLFEDNLEEISFKLNPNDLLILYTDGVTEARNKNLEEFGTDRLNEILRKYSHLTSEQILQNVIKDISVFSQEFPQHDDITMIAIKYSGVKDDRILFKNQNHR